MDKFIKNTLWCYNRSLKNANHFAKGKYEILFTYYISKSEAYLYSMRQYYFDVINQYDIEIESLLERCRKLLDKIDKKGR